jgi:transcription termination factor Rho
MDDVIYEEFKGTGNLELHLSRELSERRIFPALDIKQSGTRKEELLLAKNDLEAIWKIRRSMTGDALDYTEQLLRFMQRTSDNRAFFENLNKLEFKQHRPRNYHR